MATLFTTKRRRALQTLWSLLDRYLLPNISGGAILAISGGPDSRALMEAVACWPHRVDKKIAVLAIDHGVRPSSSWEADFVARRATRLGFDAYVETRARSHHAPEHELRAFRTTAYRKLAARQGMRTIVMAHHRDDNSEGYLMSLMGVGGGELGAAMTELDFHDDLMLCRPFVSISKRDLLLSLSMTDHTDVVRDFLDEARTGARAYVRHEILPDLYKKAPDIDQRLATFASLQRKNNSMIANLSSSLINWKDDVATVSRAGEKQLTIAALWQVIKAFNSGGDVRSAFRAMADIARDLEDLPFDRKNGAPLDPSSNGFSLKHLKVKRYQFPGAEARVSPLEIVVRRVCEPAALGKPR